MRFERKARRELEREAFILDLQDALDIAFGWEDQGAVWETANWLADSKAAGRLSADDWYFETVPIGADLVAQ